MSCNSQTPCDPCNPSKTGCENVLYTGPALECSSIAPGDTICVALQKIDNVICNPEGMTVTASNGLYKDEYDNDIRLGGDLTELTTIGASNLNTLSITGLVADLDPDFIITQTNLGVVRKTLTSVLTSNILSQISADNGITYSSNNIQLGGALIKPTAIATDLTNTLAITGLDSIPDAVYLVAIDDTTGVLTKTSLSDAVAFSVTADNGLTNTDNNIQLGGPLVQNTDVDLDGNTLSLIDSVGLGNATGIIITPGTVSDCVGCSPSCGPYTAFDWETNVNDFYGKNNIHGVTWFQSNVGIGTTPQSSNPACNNDVPLSVEQSFSEWNDTFSAGRGAITASLNMLGDLGTDGSDGELTGGISGTLNVNPTINTNLNTNHQKVYAGVIGRIGYEGNCLSTTGQLAGFTSRALFSDAGGVIAPSLNGANLETYIGFQAEAPQPYGTNYSGTLTNTIGVKIEDQRTGIGPDETSRLAGTGELVNSYGIVQGHETNQTVGTKDANIFNGPTSIYNNVGMGTNADIAPWTTTNSNSRLNVFKEGIYQNSPISTSINSSMYFSLANSGFASGGTSEYAGIHGSIFLDFNANQTVLPNQAWTGIMGYPAFIGKYNINNIELSGVIGQIYCSVPGDGSPAGNINGTTIAIYAKAPIPYQTLGWGGTITNAIGLKIQAQKTYMNGGTVGSGQQGDITNPYGIVQGDIADTNQGLNDTNIFNSKKNVFPNMVSAASDILAAAAGVPLYGLYHTAGIVKIRLT